MKSELFAESLNKPQINEIHIHLLGNLFSSEFTTKFLYAFTVYSMRATRFAHVIILFHLIALLIKDLYNFYISSSAVVKIFSSQMLFNT
jgi:hypothetical protein